MNVLFMENLVTRWAVLFFESFFRKVPTLAHNNSARMRLICYIYTYNIISTREHVRVYVVWRFEIYGQSDERS